MQKVEVWLVRHGQTDHNAQGRLSGWTDAALTELGRDQARWLRKHIEAESFDSVWSSDLGRARDTAQLAWGSSVATDRRLREIHFGDLEGETFQGLDKKNQDALLTFSGFSAPGGESVEQLEERVTEFMDSLAPGRHLLFTHGGVIRCVMHRLLNTQCFLPNGSLVAVDWIPRKLIFVRENELR
jgi:probable phosphoglycerate mutase